jgi:hypothetical protein
MQLNLDPTKKYPKFPDITSELLLRKLIADIPVDWDATQSQSFAAVEEKYTPGAFGGNKKGKKGRKQHGKNVITKQWWKADDSGGNNQNKAPERSAMDWTIESGLENVAKSVLGAGRHYLEMGIFVQRHGLVRAIMQRLSKKVR